MARRPATWLLWIGALLMLGGCVPDGEHAPGHFVGRRVQLDGQTAYYQVFVPADARARRGQLPVVLFLHGSGERGRDGQHPLKAGLGRYLRAHGDTFPALAVFPQAPPGGEWNGHTNRIALAALDASIAEFGADPARQALTGLSMGAYGSWNLALADPGRFAAIVPVCGGVHSPHPERPDMRVEAVDGLADPYAAIAQRLGHVPVWMFHGARDASVPPDDDRRLYAAFQTAGATAVRYTEYPEGEHVIWDEAYADPALWTWVWAQRN